VIVTFDSGRQLNIGWPSPADGPPRDDPNNPPSYRQIFLNFPPNDSRNLTFDVPVEDEVVHFTIKNPAYQH